MLGLNNAMGVVNYKTVWFTFISLFLRAKIAEN